MDLFVRGMPNDKSRVWLAKRLSEFGYMNLNELAYQKKRCRRDYDPYMSPEENEKLPVYDDNRHSAVLYSFNNNYKTIAGRMFGELMRLGGTVSLSWTEDRGEAGGRIVVSLNKNPVSPNVVHDLFWRSSPQFWEPSSNTMLGKPILHTSADPNAQYNEHCHQCDVRKQKDDRQREIDNVWAVRLY